MDAVTRSTPVASALRAALSGTALIHQGVLVLCLVVSLLLALTGVPIDLPTLFIVGNVILLGLSVLTFGIYIAERVLRFVPPRGRELLLVVPLLDLVVLGLTRWAAATSFGFHGILMVFPAVWLAAELRHRGALLVTALSVLSCAGGPLLLDLGLTHPLMVRAMAVSVVVSAVAFLVAGLVRERDERASRLDLVTGSIGVVHGMLTVDGRLTDTRGRLAGPARGLGIEELLADPLCSENGRDELEPERNPLLRARQGRSFVGEVVWRTLPDGRRVALSVSSRVTPDDRMLVSVHDVTASLSAVLQEEQFLATVSHELKTPLSSISGYLELLEDEAADARDGAVDAAVVSSHATVIRRNVDRLERLIMALLETARTVGATGTRAGRVVSRATDLGALVADQVESIRPRAAGLGVVLRTVGLDHRTELINADGERLAQAVDNLLSNAVKYSPGGGEVEVRLDADDQRARLTVRDRGIGIAAEDIPLLFTPYFRAGTAVRSHVPGTGIGLMNTRRVVRAHGGEVEVRSWLGEGTEVTMELPLVRS
ncbi:HAMP domain-containing histidine kinase [Brachybacterium sp. p3-SID1565]|uniref:sensor histidine kinase n=1 Tax=Brachybacterium sp. p3-SID1565 TaxID=2916046 RepID=UPI0021A7B087|nr:HAMP domain-containing sensor histidine kinase [Brachybacterium sp. p3-SID1565]MCT1385752.1 HAMP domain-containing histidine kinase [Brachybacterium sp. p3-SID1565]